jgi:hypothetical protein
MAKSFVILLLRRPGFYLRPVHVGFMMHSVGQESIFLFPSAAVSRVVFPNAAYQCVSPTFFNLSNQQYHSMKRLR